MATRAQQWWDSIDIAGVIIIVAAALIWLGVDVWGERDLIRREAEETDD